MSRHGRNTRRNDAWELSQYLGCRCRVAGRPNGGMLRRTPHDAHRTVAPASCTRKLAPSARAKRQIGATRRRVRRAGNGGGSSVEVASLDPSDVTAYANPDTPAVPPVSAAAGSTIPRADGGDSTPKGAVGGAHAGAAPQQWAQNGPAWAGINGALPVGPAGAPAAPGPAARPAQAPAAPGQASVASLVSGMVSDPQMGVRVAGNVARALKVDPAAPLTPEQALKAQLYVRNYAARAAQQPAASPSPQAASGIPGQPSAGGPITSLPPLPKGVHGPAASHPGASSRRSALVSVRSRSQWPDQLSGTMGKQHREELGADESGRCRNLYRPAHSPGSLPRPLRADWQGIRPDP